jgi:predicted RNA-binding protein with TRAM domain
LRHKRRKRAGAPRPHGTPTESPSQGRRSTGGVREVTIESVGDQGDGIAKVERGYVVIVPDGEPGDQPTVEITNVRQNVSFATIVDSGPGRPGR